MISLKAIEKKLSKCPCGREHKIGIRTLEINDKATADIGIILVNSSFRGKICVVGDVNTYFASQGIEESLYSAGYKVERVQFENLLVADIESAAVVEERVLRENCSCILSVGTGSLNDICRYVAAKYDMPFAVFATAPSMDGFASVMAPLTVNGFKRTFNAKAPEVIIADTDILAQSPVELKSAGLGDLLGKYTAHADWEIAALTTGEYYCENVASLTRAAVDQAALLARKNNTNEVAYAKTLMEALVLSGLAMLLTNCTRPASGSEHHLSHFWEMKYTLENRQQLFHGIKVGIAAGIIADLYKELAEQNAVNEIRKTLDEAELSKVFGPLWQEARKENFPNPLNCVPDGAISKNWEAIKQILSKVPSGSEIRALLRASGGYDTCVSAGIPRELEEQGFRYSRYVRFRITMMRLLDMIDYAPKFISSYEMDKL